MVHPARASDRHWLGRLAPSARVAADVRSLFVTTRDGARLAVDVHLPRGRGGERLATMVRQTRYMRALAPRHAVSRWLGVPAAFDMHAGFRSRFTSAGYAWVDVDVRGTGASSGSWRSPWFEDQRRDAYDLVAWIVAQPWSNGRVGSLGISYDGTCADMLLAEPHPAVRAIAPMFALYDVFADVTFPGGMHLAWFTAAWAGYNRALDRNDHDTAIATPLWLMVRAAACKPDRVGPERLLAALGRLSEPRFRAIVSTVIGSFVRGVADVERPRDGVPSASALRERERNLDVHAASLEIANRDDGGVDAERPELTIDSFSPHVHREAQRASGAAIYSYSGWRDAAYPHSAVKRFLTVPNAGSRLTLGPWAHTGRLAIHGARTGVASEFDHAGELPAFFDEHVRGAPARGDGSAVHYFTTGEERWHASTTWPPSGVEPVTLHVGPGRVLGLDPARIEHVDTHRVDPAAGTGERSRWRSLLSLVPGDYPDRRDRDRALLTYETAPLDAAVEVTGHAIATLFVSWDVTDDAGVFVYLEDVAPDGSVWYVTEGELAAKHRAVAHDTGVVTPGVQRSYVGADVQPLRSDEVVELRFDLLPFSHLFAAGHRVRLALAGADSDHFRAPPHSRLRVHLGPGTPSRIELPCRGGPPRFR